MMKKIIILSILIFAVSVSGCTTKTAPNGTFGEKNVSLSAITVANNSTSGYSMKNTTHYYVVGYLDNANQVDAINVKLKITTYDANNNVVIINDTPQINPNNIPANGASYFYAGFTNPDKNIARYTVEIISVKSQF